MLKQLNETNQKSERLNLFWLCSQTGRKHNAGVAFFNPEQGDYRLKVDLLPEEKTLFLKVSSSNGEKTFYRVESAVRKAGKVLHRTEVGSGYTQEKDDFIYMDIGPFARLLVMERSRE